MTRASDTAEWLNEFAKDVERARRNDPFCVESLHKAADLIEELAKAEREAFRDGYFQAVEMFSIFTDENDDSNEREEEQDAWDARAAAHDAAMKGEE